MSKTTIIRKTDIPGIAEDVGQLECTYLVDGSVKWEITLESIWQFLIKLNIHLLYDLAIPFLVIYLREKTCLNKNVYTIVHSSFSKKLKIMQMVINGWMDNEVIMYSYNGIVLRNNKECTTDTHINMDDSKNILNERMVER